MPLKNGYFSIPSLSGVLKIDGDKGYIYNLLLLDYPDLDPIFILNFTQGDFGPAKEEIQQASGIENYNLKIGVGPDGDEAVVSEDGNKIFFVENEVLKTFQYLTEQELQKLGQERDEFNSPSCPYKIQPENPGKLVWLAGAPGCGKSTTALSMARNHGYTFVEGDFIMFLINPFPPLDVDGKDLLEGQKALKVFPYL